MISAIIGGIIGWGFNWILPTKSIEANNIPQKELTCVLNYSQQLYKKTVNDEKFKILYDGKEVEEPYLYSITIINSGDYPITNEDFKKTFSVHFNGCKEIIKATVTETTNKDIFDEVLDKATLNGTELVFENYFLNPQESFSFIVITNGKPEQINYDYRIEGITDLKLINTTTERINELKKFRTVLPIVICSFLAVMLIGLIVFLIVMKKKDKQFEQELLKSLEKTTDN